MSTVGLHIAAFESRRGEEMARLIERHGGTPHVSPSMREVPIEENKQAIDFAHRLITAEIDVVILLTGVGVETLTQVVERHIKRERFLTALADTKTIARGPKPVAALRRLGVKPSFQADSPYTWREILQLVDRYVPLAGLHVGVQEYGITNPSLIAGLEARGATVIPVQIYRWELPIDTTPLNENICAILDRKIDVALFTSANQANNLLALAQQQGLLDALHEALQSVVVASIGPTTSHFLRERRITVDLESDTHKMGQLVALATRCAPDVKAQKEKLSKFLSSQLTAVTEQQREPAWQQSIFLRACRREPVPRTPIWLMRQAGRYMKEYREVRAKTGFLELCKNPSLCAEVAITAAERLDVDAAIIFSDLLPILEPMGLELEYGQGEGPIIHNPVREGEDVNRILALESVDSLHYVMDTVQQTRAQMAESMPLIGFAGAPFTLASYTIEGGGSRNFLHTKTLMYRNPAAWQSLMDRLVQSITLYLNAQIAAGVQAVQIFDSWVGCLSCDDYRKFVLPHTRQLIQGLQAGIPVIHFATGNPALYPLLAEAGGDVIGVDWRIELDAAWAAIGEDRGIMGNLDPMTLLAPEDHIREAARDILSKAAQRAGHIFNLGHGILPQIPVQNVILLVESVKALSAR
ncbi:MAG: uroporphyrinogen decarboxylase [Planctomycetaceae bacterium]|nr:uroporphyrinogen decarboxylase [Planctomycetaceae bacterium]